MVPLVSFVDDKTLQYITLDVKVYGFINHDSNERYIHSIHKFGCQGV